MNMMSCCGMNMDCGCQGDKSIFKLIILISLIALGAVFAWEMTSTIKPCILCVYERYPYGIALVLSIFAMWRCRSCTTKMALWLLTLVFLTSLGLAVYHMGVEYRWFSAPAACLTNATGVQTIYDVMRQVGDASTRLPCDQPALTFLGLSLSVYNAIISFLLVCGLINWIRKRNSRVAECCPSNPQNTSCEPRG